jgi:hypothetical protein
MKPSLADRERRQIADELLDELEKPIEGVPARESQGNRKVLLGCQ